MQKFDVPTLANQLNMLADVYEKKPVTPKALEVWFDTLKEFPTERLLSLLIAWPKAHNKFPVPSEVWKACNEMCINGREEKARAERAMNVAQPKSENGSMFLAQMRDMLERPKMTAREHWRSVLATAPSWSVGYRYAEEALSELEKRLS